MMDERIVMMMSADSAPKNTGMREYFRHRIAAMKKVLSPSSVAIIMAQLLKKPPMKDESGSEEDRSRPNDFGSNGVMLFSNSALSIAPLRFVSASSKVNEKDVANRIGSSIARGR